MVKQLLTLAAAAMLSFSASAETLDLSLDDLGSGWGATYDAATKTITYEGAWKGKGWWLGDVDYSKYDEVVVNFEKSEIGVKLVVEYVDETVASSENMVSAGSVSVKCELNPEGSAHVKQIYLQNDAVGSLTLTSAYLQNAEVFDPTKNVTLWEGTEELKGWSNSVTIANGDLKSAKIVAEDKLGITYTAAEEGGSFKVIYVNDAWEWVLLPAFGEYPGVSAEWGTLWVNAPGSIEVPLNEEAVATLQGCREIKVQGDGVTLTKVEIIRGSGVSAITDIEAGVENAPVEYFNLQGVRVANPANGLFIRRQGNEVKKVLVK